MSVRGTLGGAVAAATVLVIGWQIGSAASHPSAASGSGTTTSGGTTSGTASGSGSGTAGSGSSSSSGSGSTSTSTSSAYKDGTYTGQSISTRFGDMQVQITVSGGRITDVTPLQITDREFRSQEISQRAVPILRQEVLQAQSAQVSYVSGATYSSDGYLQSLQSALDQASS